MKKRIREIPPGVWTVCVIALLVLLWQWGADSGRIKVFFFSSPSLVWTEFVEMTTSGQLSRHMSATLKEAALGLLFGGVFGTLTGFELGVHQKFSKAVMPLITGLNGMPKLALGPLFIIWMGIGMKSKVFISALMVFFIFTFNMFSGVKSVDAEMIRAVQLLGASSTQLKRKVILPACLPWFLTALRTSLGLSLSGAIVGEYLGAGRGMGWAISNAGSRYDVTQVICCVIVLVITVILMDGAVRLLERSLLRWQTSAHSK